jgi:acyl-coenzyme A thioesterase PaaI-like protein
MTQRTGPFWDAAAGRRPLPPAAATLGFELVTADPDRGTIEAAFRAGDEFTTPLGEVLGGFLAAMLFDTVGPVVLATLPPDRFISTLAMATTFLRPARPGRLVGRGRIDAWDGDIAFVSAELDDDDGVTVATTSATIKAIPAPPAPE